MRYSVEVDCVVRKYRSLIQPHQDQLSRPKPQNLDGSYEVGIGGGVLEGRIVAFFLCK